MTADSNPFFSLQTEMTAIAEAFPLFACFDCAEALRVFLIDRKVSGQQILLSTGSTQKPFCNIYCDRLQQNISINGRHTAIAVMIGDRELIFDNIHPQGISRVEWIDSFYSPIQDLGQDFQITETEF